LLADWYKQAIQHEIFKAWQAENADILKLSNKRPIDKPSRPGPVQKYGHFDGHNYEIRVQYKIPLGCIIE